MDQVLKARKLSSASARRRKFQERQRQQALEKEKLQEHKRRVMLYDHMADQVEEHRATSADETDLDVGRLDRESSVETPSERSALTPDDMLVNRATFEPRHLPDTNAATPLKLHIPDEEEVLEMELDENRVVVPPSPAPVLQASLATLSDFRYDRYSYILDSPVSEVLSPEFDTDETFSPIETATPIAYQQPKSRPSLISIVSLSQRSKRQTTSPQSPLWQTASHELERPKKRHSMNSVRSGFPAAEARLFEVPSLPENAFQLIANASQESLLLSTKERPKSRAERKSNVPRLSTALSHARMSSIKSLIKTPTSATNPRPFSPTSSHISRPSTASISGADPSPLMRHHAASASSTALNSIPPPQTARSISGSIAASGGTNMTALPSLPTPPADQNMSDPLAGRLPRKKSFSALRRRSESIGQAIKGLGKISTKDEVPMPTTPAVATQKKQSATGLSRFPTPPLPSPRTGKSSAGSFTSTRTRSSAGGFGLGLRSVEGLSQR